MRAFNRIFAAVILVLVVLIAAANIILAADGSGGGRPYRVEVNRLALQIETDGHADISDCEYVTNIERYGENFYSTESDYIVREINGELYRFDYTAEDDDGRTRLTVTVNVILGVMAVLIIFVMIYVKFAVLAPFEKLTDVPYELSKGNLTAPVKETKNRFFGRFIWGVDMLRENIEQQKVRELELQKEKKMLLLSLSHDIKTPLSAIKLYSKALSKGLYESRGIGSSADNLHAFCDNTVTWLEGQRLGDETSESEIREWLGGIIFN